MTTNGWVAIHRKLQEKAFYKKPYYLALWIHLLLSANHKPKEFFWNNQTITIKEGQFITGRKQLNEQTGIADSTIERILNHFEKNGHQIEQQKTTKYRLITITNWKQYQKMDSKMDNKRTTNGQQADTNNNNNNDNNVTNITEPSSVGNQVNEIIGMFKEVNPSYKQLYSRLPQRAAVERLLKEHGRPKLENMINALPAIILKPYAPKVTTPYLLELKLGELIAFSQQEKNKNLWTII